MRNGFMIYLEEIFNIFKRTGPLAKLQGAMGHFSFQDNFFMT